MTWLYILLVSVAFLVVIHIFRAIQKNVTTLLEFDRFNADVSKYLRSNDPNLCKEDVEKLGAMLNMSDELMKIHIIRPSSIFHSLFFLDFIDNLVNTSYKYDESVKGVHSSNIYVEKLKNEFDDLIAWSVFYNTPYVIRISVFLRLTLSRVFARLGKKDKLFAYGKRDQWHKTIVISHELDDWKRRWELATHKMHLG